MIRKLTSILFVVVPALWISLAYVPESAAQQDPMYTHYMFNRAIYNPAYVSVNREFICLTFLNHNQWTGFAGQGIDPKYVGKAPQTQTFTMLAPVRKGLSGIGIGVINDGEGFQSTTAFYLMLGKKIDFSFGTLNFGLNGGMVQKSIDGQWLPPQPGVPDVFIPGKDQDMIPDVGFGIYLHNPIYYLGISSQHLIGGEFKWGSAKNTLTNHSYIVTGLNYTLPNNPLITLQPSLLIKSDYKKTQLDLNTNILYKERFWGGLQWRNNEALSILLGMNLTPKLQFGYSYDITTQKLGQYSNGTHEILLTYCFKINPPPPPPPPNIIWTPRYL